MRPSALAAAWLALVLSVGLATSARADRRVALVIGNSHYRNASLSLSNPKNDAEDVAAALRKLDFEVLQVTDTNRSDFDLNMAKFARLATDSDAALFYYAGHALQYQGRNYLIPVDADVEDEISLRYQTIPIDDVRVALDRASGVKVMVLDACRNNPVVDALRHRANGETRSLSAVRGLARIDRTQGMVIAFSTAADEVAADGQGRNSPFTTAFIKRLMEPGLEIEQLFRRVAADVNTATGGRQRPETYVSLLSEYYLNQTDRVAYDKIKDGSDVAALQSFVSTFPTSSYVSDARYRIERIKLDQQLHMQVSSAAPAPAAAPTEKRADEAREKSASTAERLTPPAPRAPEGKQIVARAEPPAASSGPTDSSGLVDSGRKLAALDRRSGASLMPVAPAPPSAAAPTLHPDVNIDAPPAATASPATPAPSTAACDKEMQKLAALRGNPSPAEVRAFELELTCERLRPQVARLRESLSPAASVAIDAPHAAPTLPASPVAPAPPAPVPVAGDAEAPKANAPSAPLRVAEQEMPPKAVDAGIDQAAACKKDEAKLAHLRANPSLTDVIAFGRELKCDKLRAQLARLQESLTPATAPR
jgi:hypothetical protein